MPMRKKTLRKMHPASRRYARLINDLESLRRRMKNLLGEIQSLELDSRALEAMNRAKGAEGETERES